jgi:hypothetical protein
MKPLGARLAADFSKQVDSENQLVFGFGLAGEILCCERTPFENSRKTLANGVGSWKTVLEVPCTYRVFIIGVDGQVKNINIANESLLVSFVQPVPEGVLLVGSRCAWKKNGVQKNAAIFDLNGTCVRRFTLGDGINDVRADSVGNIWVTYFDEGIFGNYGWANPGPEPIGAPGVVKFDSFGNRVWFLDAEKTKTSFPADVYAFNLISDELAYFYPYTDFPVTKIEGRAHRVHEYRCSVDGAHALALSGNKVALFGGYEPKHQLRVLELGEGTTRRIDNFEVHCEGVGKVKNVTAFGVQSALYFCIERKLFVLDDWMLP